MEQRKNLCAQVPISLHNRVTEAKEALGQTTAEYITNLLTEYFEMKKNGGKETMATNSRTMAFQISEDLFQRIKAHLDRESARLGRKVTQREFVLGLFEGALNMAEPMDVDEAGVAPCEPLADQDPAPGGGVRPHVGQRVGRVTAQLKTTGREPPGAPQDWDAPGGFLRSQEEVNLTRTSNQSPSCRFTQEEMTIAKETDLPDLLSHLGYQVRRLGSYYTTREMDSIRIKNRRSWRRYSTGQGGDAITFLQEFCGKSFPEAVNYLLEFNGHRARDPPGRPQSNVEQPKEKPTFVLPIANQDQRRVFAYLQKRGIAPQVIRDFIQAGLLYEDALHHNCVFVGKEVGGKPRFANKRGTYDLDGPGFKGDVTGSDKSVAFPLPCDPSLDWVAVFEAPIDLMSFCTMHPKVKSNAVALCGLYQGALDTYLKNHPHLKRIILCLDADGPGQEATQKLTAAYEQRGYQVSTRTPPLGKDWNEYLQHQVFGTAIKPPKTTNFEQKEANQSMADLEKLVSDKAAADTQWRELRQAERETATDLRDASINEITTNPEAYARYLELQGDNPAYGAGNIALVMIQKPEATLFGTRDRWRGLGRFVLEDEQDRGAKIFIRSPSGRGYVLSDAYDVSQTQGREVKPPLLLQDDTREMETALTVLLRFSPVPVAADRELTAAALYDPKSKQLIINPSYSDSEAFAAIAAQIAHARFHDKGFNQNYRRESYDLSAQSVSCVLCRRFGIEREAPDLSGLPDLYQGWQTQNRQKLLSSIQDMSKQIGGSIERTVAPPQRGAPAVRHDAR